MSKTIGILGGTFNPVHTGHLIVANYIAQWSGEVNEVWLMLSPSNPIRPEAHDTTEQQRLDMLRIATSHSLIVKPCSLELDMPRPSYTINTLDRLASDYPDCHFKLIIGSDNWILADRWRDFNRIIHDYGVIIYPRPGYPVDITDQDNVVMVDAPQVELSSTFIRQGIAARRDMNFFLPERVYDYIKLNNLYIH